MTKASALQKIENAGYKVTFCMNGTVLASKNQRTYRAESVNGLIKKIF